MNKKNDRHRGTPAVTPLPADLEALFAGAPKLSPADLAQLEKAASKLEKDPKFIADLAKGLIIEDILRAMEQENQCKAQAEVARLREENKKLRKLMRRSTDLTDKILGELPPPFPFEWFVDLSEKASAIDEECSYLLK